MEAKALFPSHPQSLSTSDARQLPIRVKTIAKFAQSTITRTSVNPGINRRNVACDEPPLPYRFEVQPLDRITHRPLREHIDRVGIRIYQAA